MGVTTTLINKPLNPRAQDASPLAYNRAALYSGKALDFDGVNDYINEQSVNVSSTSFSVSFYAKYSDHTTAASCGFSIGATSYDLVVYPFDGASKTFRIYSQYNDNIIINDSSIPITGVFNHYVVQSDGTNLSVYANGVLAASVAYDNDKTFARFQIGKLIAGTQYYVGQLSNFKIFNTALTPAQIADLYNNPEKIVPTGVDNTALKLWLPMMEGAGTTAFNGAPDALGSEVIINGDFSDGTNNWTAENSVISAANNQLIVDDSTNLGGDSRATQAITTEVGKKYRLVFTKISTTSTFYLGVGGGSSYNNIVYVLLGTNTGIHTIEFTATDTTTTLALITGGTGISVFANVSIKEQSGFGTISGATWTNGIGAPIAQTSVIDWNKASDGTNEVLLPAGLTTGRDITGVNLFENVRKQGALNLDGNSWAEVHDNESVDVQSFTLECWVNLEFTGTYQEFISKGDSGSNRTFELYLNNTENRFGVLVNTIGASFATQTINENQWYHVVASYDSSNDAVKGYVDSAEKLSTTLSVNPNNTDSDVVIGAWIDKSALKTNGQIAQPRIYNRALTAEEVQRNYNAGKNIYS